MFVFLCKKNYPKLLKLWLLKESNYFADSGSPSPLGSTNSLTAKIVKDWLEMNDKDRALSIYSGVDQKDLKTILKLPIDLITNIFENATRDYSDDLWFQTANIENEGKEISTIK
jgi:hypothetical protein